MKAVRRLPGLVEARQAGPPGGDGRAVTGKAQSAQVRGVGCVDEAGYGNDRTTAVDDVAGWQAARRIWRAPKGRDHQEDREWLSGTTS